MTIGEAIKAAREASGLSQAEVARRAGMSRQRVWNIENGNPAEPGWSAVKRIADAIGLDLGDLNAAGVS